MLLQNGQNSVSTKKPDLWTGVVNYSRKEKKNKADDRNVHCKLDWEPRLAHIIGD